MIRNTQSKETMCHDIPLRRARILALSYCTFIGRVPHHVCDVRVGWANTKRSAKAGGNRNAVPCEKAMARTCRIIYILSYILYTELRSYSSFLQPLHRLGTISRKALDARQVAVADGVNFGLAFSAAIFDEILIVAHNEHATLESTHAVRERANTFKIKVVRRLVEQQDVRTLVGNRSKSHATSLPTAQACG